MFKISEVRLFKKRCSICNINKVVKDFNHDCTKKGGLKSSCKIHSRECDNKRYHNQKGRYTYIITVGKEIWYLGSCVHIKRRIAKHKTNKGSSHFIYRCNIYGLILEGKEVKVWVCDTEEQGYNFTKEDLRYYEHKLIRYYKDKGHPLLNTIENSKYIERDRYIDEVIIGELIFKLSNLKLI